MQDFRCSSCAKSGVRQKRGRRGRERTVPPPLFVSLHFSRGQNIENPRKRLLRRLVHFYSLQHVKKLFFSVLELIRELTSITTCVADMPFAQRCDLIQEEYRPMKQFLPKTSSRSRPHACSNDIRGVFCNDI